MQLREKCLDEHDLLAEAEELSALCHFRHVPFVIDDNVEIALAAGADGVHVGQSDMAAKRARALLGPDKILGVSAHNAAEALAAQADGADYLGCGAAFVTGTKLDAHPVTAETMRAVTAAVNIPVVAIGGIDAANLLQLQEGEKVTLMLQQKAGVDEDNTYATMVTKQGLIKRTPLSQFRNIRKMGLIAIALNEGDSLVWSHLTKGDDEIIVATHDGAAIRFTEDGARSMGRTGHGVRVIKLREGDYVVGAGVCRPGANVLTISEEGKGRRSRIDDYRITKRGGLGIRNYSNGNVAGIKIVDDTDDLILISQNGILIRIHAADINVQSRYGSGVRVMRLVEDDKVAVVARVDRDNEAETAQIDNEGETDPTPEELAAIEAEELAQEAAEESAPSDEE